MEGTEHNYEGGDCFFDNWKHNLSHTTELSGFLINGRDSGAELCIMPLEDTSGETCGFFGLTPPIIAFGSQPIYFILA
jgi:hypothetical protein